MVIIDTTEQICQAGSSLNVSTFRHMKCVFTITGTCSIQFYLLQLNQHKQIQIDYSHIYNLSCIDEELEPCQYIFLELRKEKECVL